MRFISLLFTLLFPVLSFAATPASPAYRSVNMQSAFPASSGFIISFEPDEALCKQKYGKRWQENCAAALGIPGREETNISLSPAVPGIWRWEYGNILSFVPAAPDAIKPDTIYKASLEKLPVASSVILDTLTPSLRTFPKSAQLLNSEFLIDPSPAGEHRLTASISFNYPESASFPEPELFINDKKSNIKPELVWNSEKNKLAVSWRIEELPSNSSQAKLIFPNYGYLEEKNSQVQFTPTGKRGAVFSQNIPGGNNLLHIKNAKLLQRPDANLDNHFILELDLSLYVTPDNAEKFLTIWELPVHNSPGATMPYDWEKAPAISAQTLQASRKLSSKCQNRTSSPNSRFSFNIPSSQGRYILLRMDENLPSTSGQILGKPWFAVLRVPSQAPQLGFLQPGNILPRNGKNSLDIYSTDLERINWKFEKIRDPFLALLALSITQPFADSFDYSSIDLGSLSTVYEGEVNLPSPVEGKAQFSVIPLKNPADQAKFSGPLRISLTGYINNEPVAWASRLVMPTNLSIISKKNASGSLDCFIYEIAEGLPAENVHVEIMGANGISVFSGSTDKNGHVHFPSINGLKREKLPVAIVAAKEDDLAWLPLQDKSRVMDTAAFPVSGIHLNDKDLNVYVFGQRGVYRPGDKLLFGVLARKGDFSLLPPDLPLYAELLDPRGIKIWDRHFPTGENGFSELAWQSSATALSGKYHLNIRSSENGDIIYNCDARIENFLPETVKMKITPPAAKGWILASSAPEVEIFLQNLYGTPAKGNRIKSTLLVSPADFHFREFEDYNFTDSSPIQSGSHSISLPDCESDEEGAARLLLPDIFSNFSVMLTLNGESMEKNGGNAATAAATFPVSPMEKIIGSKMLGDLTNPNFIKAGKEDKIEFIVLDNELRKTAWHDLEYEILRGEYVTSLVSDGAGGFRYDDLPVRNPVHKGMISIGENGLVFTLPTEKPGDFVLTVKDKAGKTVAAFPYVVVGDELRKPGTNLAGSKMRLRLDKDVYENGDTIQCSIDIPYDGQGLITIERDGVKNFRWFKAKAGESIQEISLPDDFEGKGYVTVAVARDFQSPSIYMSPASFSVKPFMANMGKRKKRLQLIVPQKASPGAPLSIKIKPEKPGQILISAVDEGILLLDNFKRPDPIGQLLANRALDVQTIHVQDLIMPDHAQLQSRISPFGGGMADTPFGLRFQNPFKRRTEPPVTFWSGIFNVDADPLEIEIPIPSYYTGNLKITAVYVDQTSCGVQEKNVPVSAPIVLNPHFPLAVAPDDVFEANIVLENTVGRSIKGSLAIDCPDLLELVGQTRQELEIPANNRIVFPLRFRVTANPGNCVIGLRFTNKDLDIERPVYLSIRPITPLRTTVKSGVIKADSIIPSERNLFAFQSSRQLMASPTPFPLLAAYANYLEKYPFGCTEQLISRAFGQFLIPQGGDEKLMQAVFTALRERSSYNGVSIWAGNEPDLLLTAYAVDFLLTLRENGIYGNNDLLNMLFDALENNLALNVPNLDEARIIAYALWNLTRSGRITTRHLENLVSTMQEMNLAGWEKDLTNVLVAASKKEMRLRENAFIKPDFIPSPGLLDEFSQKALYMALLSRYFPDQVTAAEKEEFFEAVTSNLNDHAYATFSSLQGLRALHSLNKTARPEMTTLKMECGQSALTEWLDEMSITSNECEKFRISNVPLNSPIFWSLQESGFDSGRQIGQEYNGIHIQKQLLDPDGNPVQKLLAGDTVIIRISAFTQDGQPKDCVITDLLPGGCEMVFTRDKADSLLFDEAQYVDRQEERMLIFTRLAREPKIFEWKIRAMNKGDFAIPPAFAEDMGNNAIYGNTSSATLHIGEGNE